MTDTYKLPEPGDTDPASLNAWPWDTADKTPETTVPPIIGYRELTYVEIDLINQAKQLGQSLGGVIEAFRLHPDLDQRWISIGETHLQQGIMALVRAIARPTTF